MPFRVICGDQEIISSEMSPVAWRSLKRDEKRKSQLFCPDPDCGQLMIPKTITQTGTQFFAHKTAATQLCLFREEPSPEHRHYEEVVAEAIRASGWEASIEHYVPADVENAKALVDVLAIPPASAKRSPIAFEIQLSPQSDAIYEKRTERYRRAGFQTVWLTKQSVETFTGMICCAVLAPDLTIAGKVGQLTLSSFIAYLLENDVVWQSCFFNKDYHWCSFSCAMEAGEYQHEERTQEIQRLRWYLIEDLSSWASKVKLENHLWKVLDHIAEKEKLPDVRHVLEKKSLERKLGLFDGGHFIFKKSYSPPRLPDLCLWLWESENLRKKIHRSIAYDPRLDYEFWKCDCHYRHLEIGYRIFNENTPRMSRVSVIRCSRCETMHGGAGPHKSRIKPHLLNTAKQYELSRGKGFKVVGDK